MPIKYSFSIFDKLKVLKRDIFHNNNADTTINNEYHYEGVLVLFNNTLFKYLVELFSYISVLVVLTFCLLLGENLGYPLLYASIIGVIRNIIKSKKRKNK